MKIDGIINYLLGCCLCCGADIKRYGLHIVRAKPVRTANTVLARVTVHMEGLRRGYLTAMNRSTVNATTNHTLRKLHTYNSQNVYESDLQELFRTALQAQVYI